MDVWIEAALNGPWSRRRQPGMPITVKEVVADGIACARAGAAIVHVHAYDPESGLQNDDPDTYAAIIEGIRAVEDVIVYPTIPFVQSEAAFAPGSEMARYAAVEALARRGLIEWAVVDPGSIDLVTFDEAAAGQPGSVYLNPGRHVACGLDLAVTHGIVPTYAVYEPGFLRLGAAMARARPGCPAPVCRFMFSDTFTFGLDPHPEALDAYLGLLARVWPELPWMVAGLGVDIRPLIPHAVARGGHLRVGLEDAPFGTTLTNVAWVEEAVAILSRCGGPPARAEDVRRRLAEPSPTVAPGDR